MTYLIIVINLLNGYLFSKIFFKHLSFLERSGLILAFSIILTPFININLIFWAKIFSSLKIISIISILLFLILLFSIYLLHFRRSSFKFEFNFNQTKQTEGYLVLTLAAAIALFFSYYYSNLQFILSLGSYILNGEAECFYMQSFKTLAELNPELNPVILLQEITSIISTPGNILFTSALLPLFKTITFKILYILFGIILFLFSFLLLKKFQTESVIAICITLWTFLNPYVLSIEILDRNFITYALSFFLFYLLYYHPRSYIIHGFVFGIMAGTGIRFLGLLFLPSIFIFYFFNKSQTKAFIQFLSTFLLTFSFNIPHIFYHGFHSLGETESIFTLIFEAFCKWERTPFLPLPNLLFYLINILNYFGYLISCLIMAGAIYFFKTNTKDALVFSFPFALIVIILGAQRNWIEGDKYRIVCEGFIFLIMALAFGIKMLLSKSHLKYGMLLISGSFLTLFATVKIINLIPFELDSQFHEKRWIYQRESGLYQQLQKEFLLKIPILPNFDRLFDKKDLTLKRADEDKALTRLFPNNSLPKADKFKSFYKGWQKDLIIQPIQTKKNNSNIAYVNLVLDFNKLCTDPDQAIQTVDKAQLLSIDLEKQEDLFEVYFYELQTDWQLQPLTITVLTELDEMYDENRIYIDLNSFQKYAVDELNLPIINPIHANTDDFITQQLVSTGLSTFPLYNEDNKIFIRAPLNFKIILRNWLIDGTNSSPLKTDSWLIKIDTIGRSSVKFYFNEPESYL